ncbi:Regulator of chromosome condensation (RCC1) repeat protein [compost metagenome]
MSDPQIPKKIHRRFFLARVAGLSLFAFIEAIPKNVFAFSAPRLRRAKKLTYTLWSWGYGSSGQLGNGATSIRSSPVQVGGNTAWSAVSAGSDFSLSLRADGTVWSFGNNNTGQLGQGTTTSRSSPIRIGTLSSWAKISAGLAHIHLIKKDGTLWSSGYNSDGQLGVGNRTSRFAV